MPPLIDGKKLRELRFRHAWSQESLANKARISYDAVNKLELCKRQPSYYTIRALAACFKLTTAEFLDMVAPAIPTSDARATEKGV